MSGMVYLLQPADDLGSNCFKIGMSKSNTTKRINQYGSKSQIICTRECSNPRDVEKTLIKKFNKLFQLYKGREYFTGDKLKMIECFDQCIKETAKYNMMEETVVADTTNFPTFKEIETFIRAQQSVTICQIRDYFHQKGDSVMIFKLHGKIYVSAFGINPAFYRYLQTFMRQPFVNLYADMMVCLIEDKTRYVPQCDNEEFYPIVLAINQPR